MWAKAIIIWEMVQGAIFLYKEFKGAYKKFKRDSIEKAIKKRKEKLESKLTPIQRELQNEPSEESDARLKKLYRELNSIID